MAASTVKFSELLRTRGVGSDEAEQYKAQHADDATFLARAAVIEELFRNRDQVIHELQASEPRKVASVATGRATGATMSPIA